MDPRAGRSEDHRGGPGGDGGAAGIPQIGTQQGHHLDRANAIDMKHLAPVRFVELTQGIIGTVVAGIIDQQVNYTITHRVRHSRP